MTEPDPPTSPLDEHVHHAERAVDSGREAQLLARKADFRRATGQMAVGLVALLAMVILTVFGVRVLSELTAFRRFNECRASINQDTQGAILQAFNLVIVPAPQRDPLAGETIQLLVRAAYERLSQSQVECGGPALPALPPLPTAIVPSTTIPRGAP